MSELEDLLQFQMRVAGVPAPVLEHRFHDVRKWRMDFAWPDLLIAVEVEGGTWAGGRHTRGAGFEKDCEKYNTAALLGWRVYRFTSSMIKSGRALETIEEAFGA